MFGLDSTRLCRESPGLQTDAPSTSHFLTSTSEPLIFQCPAWKIVPLLAAWEGVLALDLPKPCAQTCLPALCSPSCILLSSASTVVIYFSQHCSSLDSTETLRGLPSLWVPVVQHRPLSTPLTPAILQGYSALAEALLPLALEAAGVIKAHFHRVPDRLGPPAGRGG